MKRVAVCVAATLVLGTACSARKPPAADRASSVGTSQIEHFEPPALETRRAETRNGFIIPPSPLEQALPVYPETALGDEVECMARILYHVEISGKATLVRLEWETPPPQVHAAGFEQAIRAALTTWDFQPAVRLIPEQHEDGSIRARHSLLPKAQHAHIRFRVEDGKPIVE